MTMSLNGFTVPTARGSVADPKLWRPDWTTGVPRDPSLLWLDKNENTDPELAALTARVLGEIDLSALHTYPECAPLYHKLGRHLGISADRLLLAAGSDGVIRSVFEAFISPGDVVVHSLPTFAMYAVYSQMYGARVVPLIYQPSERGPSLPIEEVLKTIAAARPRLVCLPNPDSPTGTVFAPDALRQIIEAAGTAGAVMLLDEAYYPFYNETALPWIDEYPHLVIARTFAKAWGLSGLRIGHAAASPEMIRLLHKVRPMYEVNTLAVAFMERMLDLSHEVLASVRRLNEGRDTFLTAMEKLSLRTLRGQGNFLHVAFGAHAPAVHSALKDAVLFRLDFNEPCLKGFSRFSATTAGVFQPVIDRIRRVVRG
jgi:histidinol-phosphate aminotransferase